MNEDSLKLLKECNSGCKSATNAMEQVMPFVKDVSLNKIMKYYNDKHIAYGDKCHKLLNEQNKNEEDPNKISAVFAWIGTETKLILDNDTEKIADIMVDGCNMGIKSLSKYINKYKNSEQKIIDLAKELIEIEETFMKELLSFL